MPWSPSYCLLLQWQQAVTLDHSTLPFEIDCFLQALHQPILPRTYWNGRARGITRALALDPGSWSCRRSTASQSFLTPLTLRSGGTVHAVLSLGSRSLRRKCIIGHNRKSAVGWPLYWWYRSISSTLGAGLFSASTDPWRTPQEGSSDETSCLE